MKKVTRNLLIVNFTFLFTFFSPSCGNQMTSLGGIIGDLSSSSQTPEKVPQEPTTPPPEQGNISEWPRGEFLDDCINSTQYDACLVFKNPVVHNNSQPISGGLKNNTSLYNRKLQNFAVKIEDLDNSGFLQNRYFTVDPNSDSNNNQPRKQANANGSWMYKYEDDFLAVNQIMMYYYINEFRSYLEDVHSTELFQGAFFEVDSYENFENNAYFSVANSGTTGRVSMGFTTINGNNHHNAISSDVTIHEACHGYFYFATNGNIGQVDQTTHSGNSCRGTTGCLRAIHEGQADFCTYIFYNDDPRMGETFMNTSLGFPLRNYNATQNISASQLFSRTGGAIHDYGSLYASMWWTIWLAQKPLGKEKEVEKLFLAHLAMLDFRETFTSALQTIQSVANSEFPGSNYSQLFEDEWARRGL